MITIKVVRESTGKPVSGASVSVGLDGFFSGGVTSRQLTDSSGEAHFDVDPGPGSVYVDGSTKYKGRVSGRVVVYV